MKHHVGLGAVAAGLLLAVNVSWGAEAELENWVQAQTLRSRDRLFEAISPAGAARGSVMASPSTQDPNYYYHWIRDAALVMREVFETRSVDKDRAINTLMDFAVFSRRNQTTANPSGPADGRGVGEPKFYMDGSPFWDGWGRPQNDGPALRALVLMDLAYTLANDGRMDWVRANLYRAELPARTAIKADLEYVSHHWRDKNFDLWEEISGDHFYTRISQWRALDEGTRFAAFMGDQAAATWYASQAKLIQQSLNGFWSDQAGYLLATTGRDRGAHHKASQLDSAIVLGVLHAGRAGEPFYVDDERVMATVKKIEEVFGSLYRVNSNRNDHFGQTMGHAIGRYPEDTYNGLIVEGSGNPWFLTTHALAEYYLRLERTLNARGEVLLTPYAKEFFSRYLDRNALRAMKIHRTDPSFKKLLARLKEQSDRYLRRSRYHTSSDGHQSEQLNRNTGYMQGARDLTWSYASFLSMERSRR